VWPEGVVFVSPPLDEYLSFLEGVEDLSIQQFVSEFPVEAFAVAVFPWATGLDVEGSHPCSFKPLTYRLGGEFRAVVRSDMFRWAVGHEEVGKAMEHIVGIEPSLHYHVEALPTEFIYDRQDLDETAVVSAVFYKIIGPDMVPMGGPEPDTRPIVEPQTSSFGLLLGNLQPLLTPDAFHPLVIDPPALSFEQGCDTAIPVTPIPFGKLNNFLSKSLFGICPPGYEPLGRPRLADHAASTSL